jgi:hypothetical protein
MLSIPTSLYHFTLPRALETTPELGQEAWNLANDSLHTTLCVRFNSEVVACGVVYAATRRTESGRKDRDVQE